MTEFEQRVDTLIMMLADPNVTINPSGFAKIKENILSSAKEELWHDAQGDILPEIDREVIVLCDDGFKGYKVCFAHRPFAEGYDVKNLDGKVLEHITPKIYGKGGWSIPNVKWWLDCVLPYMEKQND